MAGNIEWVKDLDQALSRAKSENKFIFLDFYNPQ